MINHYRLNLRSESVERFDIVKHQSEIWVQDCIDFNDN